MESCQKREEFKDKEQHCRLWNVVSTDEFLVRCSMVLIGRLAFLLPQNYALLVDSDHFAFRVHLLVICWTMTYTLKPFKIGYLNCS